MRSKRVVLLLSLMTLAAALPFAAQAEGLKANEIPREMVWGSDIASLHDLVARADVVVAGVVHRGTMGRRVAGTPHVETIMHLWLEEVFKGDLPVGGFVTIGQPGGILREGREIVESRLPADVPRIGVGRRYVLFLKGSASRPGFDLAAGPQGTVELRERALPHDLREGRRLWEGFRGLSPAAFFDRLRKLVPQGQRP